MHIYIRNRLDIDFVIILSLFVLSFLGDVPLEFLVSCSQLVLVRVQCKSVLSKLHGAVNKDGRRIAALFLELPKRSELPEYYKVIARPINSHSIEEKLDRSEYPSVLEFASDVHQMIDNAARYYSTSSEVFASFNSTFFVLWPQVEGTDYKTNRASMFGKM